MKKTIRDENYKKDLIKRINIISGQIDGIKKMVIDDRYCGDILIQISAVEKAIQSLGNKLLDKHLNTCVVRDIKEGNNDAIEEVMNLIKKLQ